MSHLSTDMSLNDYQIRANATNVIADATWLEYVALKLCGESGEFAEKVAKGKFRGDAPLDMADLDLEVGDILWYVAQYFTRRGMTLEQGAMLNLRKLADRKRRGVLKGSGDYR